MAKWTRWDKPKQHRIRKSFVIVQKVFVGGVVPMAALVLLLYMPVSTHGHDNHMMRMTAQAAESFNENQALLPRNGWTATASDAYTSDPASNVLDGDAATIWHSKWDDPVAPLPHSITIDTQAVQKISGLSYLPRQDGSNGRIGQYTITVSSDGVTFGDPVAQGTWADTAIEKQITFNTVDARYVRLTALTEAGNRGPYSSAAEINLAAEKPNTTTAQALPRNGWTATASDAYTSDPASNVLDGDAATIWHSKWDDPVAPLPHSITIDMKSAMSVSGLTYQPRQDGSNGRIGQYSITVSVDGTTFGPAVASGTWADDTTTKTASFPATDARYVRLTALTEAGNRGPYSSAAEINIIGDITNVVNAGILPRGGWTITASDSYDTDIPSRVLDGDTDTIWHSKWDSPTAPLPHSLTLDMKYSHKITGLNYLPRQDSGSNGNIGDYQISTSQDGTTWNDPVAEGTWADTKDEKKVTFPATDARYVRLTALTEAGNRGPYSSAAEINIVGELPPPINRGKWGASISFPIVPTSAVVLPNNKLLTFSAYSPTNFDYTSTITAVSIFDLTTGAVSQPDFIDTNHQMFCTGITLLPDGKVLINGGSSDSATTIYDPFNDSWTIGPKMTIPRAYQGNTLLSNGQVLTLGGSWYDSAGNKSGELWEPNAGTGSWKKLPGVVADNILTNDPRGVYRADNHAWLFGVSNGNAFHAGPSKQMNWITTAGDGTIESAGLRGDSDDAMNGNAVMYDIGKILTVGGSPAYEDSEATSRAYTIDITGGPSVPVQTTRVGNMAYERAFGNSVVMPDGTVMVLGGQPYPKTFTDTAAVLNPELWDPATGQFTVLSPESTPRTYHSVAVLLPDGRVFSGGGGLCGNCKTNHLDGQIFTPPYLLNEDGTEKPRPAIESAPTTAAPGSTITVATSGNTPGSTLKFVLIRTSSVTHSLNSDQRRVPLTAATTDGTHYTMQIPSDRGIVLPGYYMIFALDGSGTPSVSTFIQIN